MKSYSESKIPRLFELMQEKRIKGADLTRHVGASSGNISDWKNGRTCPARAVLASIAEYLGTTPEYLLGETDQKEKPIPKDGLVFGKNAFVLDKGNYHLIPVFESVSAGFGAYANEVAVDYMPCYLSSNVEAEETIFIKVQGNSMSPKIENGDTIQVHKQTSVDSGQIAVILLNGDDGLVKKVVYGETWIELHSLNRDYPVMRFEGEDVMRVRVVGLVKKVIKEM